MPATSTPVRGPGRPVNPELRTQRRTAILDAATQLFAKHGYPDTDVQWVADRLEISKGTIYRYFPTKEAIFLAAVDHGLDQLKATLDRIEEADPLIKLERAIREFLAFFRRNPNVVELIIQERAAFRDRSVEPAYFSRRRKDHGPWEKLIADLIAARRLRSIPVKRIMEVIGDLVFGTMFTDQIVGRRKPLRDQARDLIDVAFHGILSQNERRRRKRSKTHAGQSPSRHS